MGGFLSGLLGTNSEIGVTPQSGLGLQDFTSGNRSALQGYGQAQTGQINLASQLQALAAGQGPNPALAQLQQTMGQNAAQAAGVYANNRGINAGLAARQVAQQQGNLNQQAAGQAATLAAQQQLGAQSALGGLYGQMANQNLGLYGINQGAQAAQNQALNQGNSINAGVASGNQNASEGIVGGVLGGVGAGLGMFKNKGGMISHYDAGGEVTLNNPFVPGASGPQSFIAKYLNGAVQDVANPGPAALQRGFTQLGGGIGGLFKPSHLTPGTGTMISDMGSAGTSAAPAAAEVMVAAKGGAAPMNFKPGGQVPGKAALKGDHLKNDTVPAMLSPGEVVVPRSITQSQDAAQKAAAFVAAVLAHQKRKKA